MRGDYPGAYVKAAEFYALLASHEQQMPEAQRSPILAQRAEHYAELNRLDQLKPVVTLSTNRAEEYLELAEFYAHLASQEQMDQSQSLMQDAIRKMREYL